MEPAEGQQKNEGSLPSLTGSPTAAAAAAAGAAPPPSTTDTPTTTNNTASPTVPPAAAAKAKGEVWGIDFSLPKTKRKATKKERDALQEGRLRRAEREAKSSSPPPPGATPEGSPTTTTSAATGAVDSEGNTTTTTAATADAIQMVQVDGLEDHEALIPRDLTTTREDLAARLCLRLPRLLCVNKQYPRSCGISSFTSIYNYLYSWVGESEAGRSRPPTSQEEIMNILGFEPPFGEIAWGGFTGNATLLRWFHAMNRHFKQQGRAYILYKAHGGGKTTHLYENNAAVLAAVKAALRDPHCALIYHCHNHYMVPIGFQEIPKAQVDFLKPTVPEEDCETTIFIGEVSRGRHEAMYARKWSEIVKDIECLSPQFYNIRKPELGIQTREKAKKAGAPGSATPPPATTTTTTTATEEESKRTASPTPPPPAAAAAVARPGGPNKGKKKERGNLHCLICFRNDEVEPDPSRFENPTSSSSSSESDDEDVD